MKIFSKILLSLALVFTFITTAKAEEPEYHYGYILSCGIVVYDTLPIELEEEECLLFLDIYEAVYCGNN